MTPEPPGPAGRSRGEAISNRQPSSLKIEGAHGVYELDCTYFTNRELDIIQSEAGVRAGELQDAIDGGNPDLMIALARIAALRQRKQSPSRRSSGS
jgi:hypothetical protein